MEREALIGNGTLISKTKVDGQCATKCLLVLRRVVLCWRLSFNLFCTPLPVIFMSHKRL